VQSGHKPEGTLTQGSYLYYLVIYGWGDLKEETQDSDKSNKRQNVFLKGEWYSVYLAGELNCDTVTVCDCL
jgi:hypothetical protein